VALKVVALAGGVGGARLADGLAMVLPPDDLTVVVNTGDDFEHLGLAISPDLDTVVYTLAGVANPDTGWGRAGESWHFLESLAALGGPTWFRLGDKDLALHIERTRRLHTGESLSQVTEALRQALGVRVRVLPMTDDPVHTIVQTDASNLPFQEYFVARRCEPGVRGFRFRGVQDAQPAPGVVEALDAADVVVLCPSNPFVSLDPILAVPGLRAAVAARPVVGVSPIVGGRALKGPAAKIFGELGIEPSARAVVDHYAGLLDGFIIDREDRGQQAAILADGVTVKVTDAIMHGRAGRRRLADEVVALAEQLVSARR
jgi:LPPG:FO 2-phospho-L-lactate transferase